MERIIPETKKPAYFFALIEVTEEDIKNGKRFDISRCPVALAIQRITGLDPDQISVGVSYCKIGNTGKTIFPFTDPIILHWIERFDKLIPVQPIKFNQAIPEWIYNRIIAKQK